LTRFETQLAGGKWLTKQPVRKGAFTLPSYFWGNTMHFAQPRNQRRAVWHEWCWPWCAVASAERQRLTMEREGTTMTLPAMHSWECLKDEDGPAVLCESDAILYSDWCWFYFALFSSLLNSWIFRLIVVMIMVTY